MNLDTLNLKHLPLGWKYIDNIFYTEQYGETEEAKAYSSADGCRQRERSSNLLQAGYYDMPFYREALGKVADVIPKTSCVVDLGCGDGRLSKEVLSSVPESRVVAIDFNPTDLKRLWAALSWDEKERITLICSSANKAFPWTDFADAVILSEVAYTLSDPLDAYRAAWRCLKPGGMAMVSNVSSQAYFAHALLNGDWGQVESILCEKKFVDTVRGQSEHTVEVHLYDKGRMHRDAEAVGFEVLECMVVPAEPALLLHGMRLRGELSDEKISLLKEVSSQAAGIERIYISLLRKAV